MSRTVRWIYDAWHVLQHSPLLVAAAVVLVAAFALIVVAAPAIRTGVNVTNLVLAAFLLAVTSTTLSMVALAGSGVS